MTKTSNKILIIGLGNPGRRYKKTRHNVGFLVIDEFKKSFDEARDKEITLFKPQTFMNQSGKEVKKVIENCKLKIENLYVVHDDIDLPLGTIRISQNASSAGHKGIQSIIDELGTKDFARFRIGIKPLLNQDHDTENLVLTKFSKQEKKIIKQVIKKAVEIIKKSLKEGIKKTTMKIFQ